MAIDFSGLWGALFDFSCFERLKWGTTASDGINLAILEWAAMIALCAIMLVPGLQVLMHLAPAIAWATLKTIAIYALLGLAAMLVVFLLYAALASSITASVGGGQSDFPRTVGLLGYVSAGFTIILVIPLYLLLMGVAMAWPMGAVVVMGLVVPLFIGLAVWEWLSSSKAVSVACGTSWAAGIGGTLIAGIVMVVILMILALGFQGLTFYGAL